MHNLSRIPPAPSPRGDIMCGPVYMKVHSTTISPENHGMVFRDIYIIVTLFYTGVISSEDHGMVFIDIYIIVTLFYTGII